MKTLQQQLINYAHYHRSKRNILTHFIGIPLIVYAVLCALARISIVTDPLYVTAAGVAVLITSLYYLALSFSLGIIMVILLSLLSLAAMPVAGLAFIPWLIISISSFVVGWFLQFVGHYFEGKKPAFVDDLIGLIIGPLFVVVETLFVLGLYKELEQQIIAAAGPTKA
ncbi:DUF962 domain-containing protein [Pseudoalteromonas mariniglutinosa]|uniref:Mpo1 family 2-hydroxy fatty acid dioxygenase n=1 Tax=Pseudoalteromonas mariniglutinosa TaxID=206042 RepID=UPI003851088B